MNRVVTSAGVGAAVVGIALAAPLASAKPGGTPAIPLNTAQETTGATGDASGFFSYTIDGDELCYTLSVADLSVAPFAAHIHAGPRHVAGPISITLVHPAGTTATSSACVTAADGSDMTPAELASLAADPRATYVNVHTSSWPGGEVRGQLKK